MALEGLQAFTKESEGTRSGRTYISNSFTRIKGNKMIINYFLIFLLFNFINFAASTKADIEKEEDSENIEIKLPTHLDEEEYKLVNINEKNYKEIVNQVEHFFLFIHNPWCKFSQKMDEKLINIHKILKLEPQPYYIGILDSSLVNSIAFIEKYISSENLYVSKVYPKLIYFHKGLPQEIYTDKHNRDSILNFIKRKIYSESIKLPIQSIFDYKVIHDKSAFIYVGRNFQNESLSHGEKLVNKESLELFNKIAQKDKNLVFYHTQDKKVVDYLFSKNSTFTNDTIYPRNANVLYFSKGKLLDVYLNERLKVFFDRSLNYFISKQVYKNYFIKFNEDAINEVFMKKKPAFILFRNIYDNKTEHLEQNLPLLASQEQGIKFIVTDLTGKYEVKLAKLMLISNNNLPSIRIIDFHSGLRRYEYEGDFQIDNVMNFIRNWKKGEYKPYYSSQAIPPEASGKKKEIVKRIGNSNFYEYVVASKKNVLVFFYTQWCGHCKKVINKF